MATRPYASGLPKKEKWKVPDISGAVIQQARESELLNITRLIHLTIEKCYPAIYPDKVVQYFLDYHSFEEVQRRYRAGYMAALHGYGEILGTGFVVGNELGGVYVHPDYQKKGYGRQLVSHLIHSAKEQRLEFIWLDATPIAKPLYDRMDFKLVSPMLQMVDDAALPYFKMEMHFNLL